MYGHSTEDEKRGGNLFRHYKKCAVKKGTVNDRIRSRLYYTDNTSTGESSDNQSPSGNGVAVQSPAGNGVADQSQAGTSASAQSSTGSGVGDQSETRAAPSSGIHPLCLSFISFNLHVLY